MKLRWKRLKTSMETRRDLLKKGTGPAVGAFGTGASLTRVPLGAVHPDAGFEHAGIRYFLPSLFEYSLGPWETRCELYYRRSKPDATQKTLCLADICRACGPAIFRPSQSRG